MATTILPSYDGPLKDVDLEEMRKALVGQLVSSQGDSDKAGETDAVCWYDGQVNILTWVLGMLVDSSPEEKAEAVLMAEVHRQHEEGTVGADIHDANTPGVPCPDHPQVEPEQPAVGLRLLAHYPMMGDQDGVLWAESMFAHARAEGLITGFKVLHSQRTVFGIQDIVFTVDIDWSGPVSFHATFEQAKEVAASWLNGTLIQDSDVELLSLSPLHPADITTEV